MHKACLYLESIIPKDQCINLYAYQNIYKPEYVTDGVEFYETYCCYITEVPKLFETMSFWAIVYFVHKAILR
jgi:hypothetical protein